MLNTLTERLDAHLPGDPRTFGAALYGVSWQSSVLNDGPEVSGSWRTRRLPPPLHVAPLLVPALDGLAGHDGRSTRNGRGSGWWLLDDASGLWREADTDALGLEVLPALGTLALEAQKRAATLRREWLRVNRETARARHEQAGNALSGARLRLALLEALSALVASGSSGRWGAVTQALRSSLPLPLPALSAIVLDAIREAAEVEGWEIDSRVSPAMLWEAVDNGGTALPRRTFLRALPTLLGAQRKVGGHRFHVLPDLDEVEVPSARPA